MSRLMTYLTLGLLIVILGVMSWVVERAGKPDPPKTPTAQENAAREAAMKQRMEQEAASRAKMMESLKNQTSAKKGGVETATGKRPVNPTAPPEPPKTGKLPAGALDVTGDWFKNRKPGDVGLSQLEQEAAEEPPAPQPPPKPAPAMRPQ
ncbi:MAG: hypothetical protein GX446_09610 [Chthonomonadales bacterium]|nr:hypothetical protein [Chthonomonadales bacterium]